VIQIPNRFPVSKFVLFSASTSARSSADGMRQRMAIRDRGEGVRLRFERRDSFGLDGRFVHERGVEIADSACLLAGRRADLSMHGAGATIGGASAPIQYLGLAPFL
jgi:hypothetical protein